MEVLYVIIVACVIGILVIGVRMGKLNLLGGPKEDPKPEKPTEPVPGLKPPEPKPGKPEKEPPQRPLDAVYAESAGMWLCPCCETMNPYPEGYDKRKKPGESVNTVSAPPTGSSLRGDLANKLNGNPAPADAASEILICIACGKQW